MAENLFSIFSSRLRRRILLKLLETPEDTWISVSWATDDSNISRETRTIQMVHNDLPYLAEANLIRWDQKTNEIARGRRFGEHESAIRHLAKLQSPGKFN